jgi:O-antigen/teichoic acid export membrane protein
MTGVSTYLRRGGLAMIAIGAGGFAADYALNIGLSRLLDPHEYGDFKVARTFAAFFGAAVLLGGDRAAPRALAGVLARREWSRAWEYLRFYLRIGLGLSALVVALTWLASLLHVGHSDPEHHHAIAWLAVCVPFLAVGALASRTLQSAQRPVLAALPWRVGLPLLILAVVGAVAWLRPSIELTEVLLASIAATVAITAWQGWDARRAALPELADLRRDPAVAQPRRWLATSLPMMGFFLVTVALSQSDLYFLEALGDEHEVGLYAAAETTAHFLVLIQTTVVGLMAPLVSLALETGGEAPAATRRQGLRVMLTGLVPASVLLAAAGDPILGLFGGEYVQAEPELHLLLIGNFAWATAALAGLWLQYTGRGHAVVVIAAVTLALDSGANALLIPLYGMRGAAASTAVALSLAGLAVAIARRRLPVRSGPVI